MSLDIAANLDAGNRIDNFGQKKCERKIGERENKKRLVVQAGQL